MEENTEQQEKAPWDGLTIGELRERLTPEEKELYRRCQYARYADRKDDIYYEDVMGIVAEPGANPSYDDVRESMRQADIMEVGSVACYRAHHPIRGWVNRMISRIRRRIRPQTDEERRLILQRETIYQELYADMGGRTLF